MNQRKKQFGVLILVLLAMFFLFNPTFASLDGEYTSQNAKNEKVENISFSSSQDVRNHNKLFSTVEETDAEKTMSQRTNEAVSRALRYLADNQEENGSWLSDVGYKLNDNYEVTKRRGEHPGVTSIACLAFMANGHFPGRGQYGDVVRKGLNFVLSTISEGDLEGKTPGFITWDGTRMYSHAFATLFLAEILGMANFSAHIEKLIRDKLRLAIQLIIKSQNHLGAWRYEPNAPDADVSIAVCQLQALRAARNVGFRIPVRTIDRAREYIARNYDSLDGGFFYQFDDQRYYGKRKTWTLTAAGICAMQQAGQYEYFYQDDKKVYLDKSIEYLHQKAPRYFYSASTPLFDYFYGHYYAAQAIYQYSVNKPHIWRNWIYNVRRDFLKIQRPNGSWADQVGANYATAMASLILQIHHEYLPIFQK